jgi:hypothetical protein
MLHYCYLYKVMNYDDVPNRIKVWLLVIFVFIDDLPLKQVAWTRSDIMFCFSFVVVGRIN